MKYDFVLRPIIIAFNQPSGLMNFTNFMEGVLLVLLILSTGFASGIWLNSIRPLLLPVRARLSPLQSRPFGTRLVEARAMVCPHFI
jgi:hypothetical protein